MTVGFENNWLALMIRLIIYFIEIKLNRKYYQYLITFIFCGFVLINYDKKVAQNGWYKFIFDIWVILDIFTTILKKKTKFIIFVRKYATVDNGIY